MFLIKFNGACLRPPVPRPITGNRTVQVKFVDDSTQAASINLRESLMEDPDVRMRPLKYNERNGTKLKPEENILQSELNRFYRWTVDNKLLVNSKKCFIMKFSRSKQYDFPPEYTIGGSDILEEQKEMRILGILVQSNLGWNAQINQMVGKASKTIWVLRRMKALGVDETTLVNFWTAEGRVHLEMGCPVWHSSLTLAQSRALDRCQRVAMAAIVGHWAPSHTQQLADLGLSRLFARRVQICRRFAQSTAEKSRHRDIFTAAHNNPGRQGKHTRHYLEPRARTATYYKSPVPYLTRLLNNS